MTAPPRPAGPHRDRGAVTAELAVLLPAVVALLLVLLVAGSVGAARLQVGGAARAAARSAALGEDTSQALVVARRVAGDGVAASVAHEDGWVVVRVSRTVGLPAASFTVSATATAWVER